MKSEFSSQRDWNQATTYYFIISPPIQRFMWASELDYQGNFSKGSSPETRGRPYLMKVILFAHKFNKHTSTKYLPFFLLYNRNPPYQSTWNLNWSSVKRSTVISLLIKKCLLLFFQLLSLWEKKHLLKTFVMYKQNTNVIIILVIKFLLTSSWAKKYFWRKGKTEKFIKFYTEHTISEKQFCF